MAEERLGGRGRDASDATAQVARELSDRADPWPGAIDVDTARRPDEVVAAALDHIGRFSV